MPSPLKLLATQVARKPRCTLGRRWKGPRRGGWVASHSCTKGPNKQREFEASELRMLMAMSRLQCRDDQRSNLLIKEAHRSKRAGNDEPICGGAHLDVGHGIGEAGCSAERQDDGAVVVCQQTLQGTAIVKVSSEGYIA